MAKKTINDRLLALEDDLIKGIELEDDDRIKAGMLNVLKAMGHLKDSISTAANLAWTPGEVARNKRGRP